MLYEITTDDGLGFATCHSRRRADAARRALYATIYQIAEGQGLRDQECARSAIARLNEALEFRALGATRSYKLGYVTITISCSQTKA